MLSTELFTFFAVFLGGLVVALLSLRQRNLEATVREAVKLLNARNARSQMAQVEASLTELTDAYDALLASHKKLRSRIGMRHVREDRKENAVPDSATDPAGYKKAMRLKLNSIK